MAVFAIDNQTKAIKQSSSSCSQANRPTYATESIEVDPLFSTSIVADPMTGQPDDLPDELLKLLQSMSPNEV